MATKELISGSAETTGFRIFRTNQASGDHIQSIFQNYSRNKRNTQWWACYFEQ
jgi:hypothetical protein